MTAAITRFGCRQDPSVPTRASQGGLTLITVWSCFGQSAASIYRNPRIGLIPAHWTGQGVPVQATSNPQDVDPNEIGIVPEHEELVGYVYKRVVREVLARIDQRLAELEKHATTDGSEAQSVLSGSDSRGW